MYTPAEMIQLIYEGHHTLNPEKLNAHVQPLEENDIVTAERKVSDELSRKRDNMREEVKQLASHALSIEDSFDQILRGLEEAKAKKNMPKGLAADVVGLIEQWKVHQKVSIFTMPCFEPNCGLFRHFERTSGNLGISLGKRESRRKVGRFPKAFKNVLSY